MREHPCKRCDRLDAIKERCVCVVCGIKPPHGDYQATDKTWAKAGFQPSNLACFKCFLKKLRRPVTVDDFVDVPVNAVVFWALEERK